MKRSFSLSLATVALGVSVGVAAPAVVINEVFYHASGELNDLQWVELHNPGPAAVDLSDWTLAGTPRDVYRFPAGSQIPAQGFWIGARATEVFQKHYARPAQSAVGKVLRRSGGTLELRDARGTLIEKIAYDDEGPWPRSPDGHGSSLERVSVQMDGRDPDAWLPSPPAPQTSPANPGGTPGRSNAHFSPQPIPGIPKVQWSRSTLAPGDALRLQVSVASAVPLHTVQVHARLLGAGQVSSETAHTLTESGGGQYAVELTAPATPGVWRLRLEIVDTAGARRWHPHPHDLRPTLSIAVQAPPEPGKIGRAWLYSPEPLATPREVGEPTPEERARWSAQQRFADAADLSALWASLALENPLEPGQARRLKPFLAARYQQRNTLLQSILETGEPAAFMQRVETETAKFRAELAEGLKPLLTPKQQPLLESWAKGLAPAASRGWSPERMLKRWINLEFGFMAAALTLDWPDDRYAAFRALAQKSARERDQLVEPAKTAFSSNESREKFQQSVAELQERLESGLAKLASEDERASITALSDPAMVFRRGNAAAAGTRAAVDRRGALLYWAPGAREPEVRDYVDILPRKAGWKVQLAGDQPLAGMTGINLIYEELSRFVLAEPLAFDLYRAAGNAAPQTEFWRMTINGQNQGYHLMVEQPNKAFLRRQGRRDDGNLYKLGWQGNTLEELHEKKTNLAGTHDDLKGLINALNRTEGDAQWEVLRTRFHLPQVLTYFAVNSLLAHWDGYMNNYFAYHDVHGSKKWELYPWDQDKTFGFHDALRSDTDIFVELPLRFGATGDLPPGWKGRPPRSFFETIQRPGMEWWRPPGPFSGPILAHPRARAHYLARIKELLNTVFTEARMSAALQQLDDLLREEVRARAQAKGEDPTVAGEKFQENLRSLKRFVSERRRYLLQQPEIQAASPMPRAELE